MQIITPAPVINQTQNRPCPFTRFRVAYNALPGLVALVAGFGQHRRQRTFQGPRMGCWQARQAEAYADRFFRF